MAVILRTHGGLGNQIFQILFGRLYENKKKIPLKEVHDPSYGHGFKRSSELIQSNIPLTSSEEIISSIRIPKILTKLNIMRERPLRCMGSIYLDGYFQKLESYSEFDDSQINLQLKNLASELGVPPASKDQTLIHIRLGDFFKDREAARSHALARLQIADPNSAIITNDEDLLYEPEFVTLLEERSSKIISTVGMSAEQVLRLMAKFRHIKSNDSTLVFWSSILGGCTTQFSNKHLKATHAHFSSIFKP